MNCSSCGGVTTTRQEGNTIVVYCTQCGAELGRIGVGGPPEG